MFALSEEDLARTIVGVADGPAGFNAELRVQGGRVISVDPLYTFGAREIAGRFHAVVDGILRQGKETPDGWVWTSHRSPNQLRERRIQTLRRFLAGYEDGRSAGRYVPGELPRRDSPDG